MTDKPITRRKFLANTAATSGLLIVPGSFLHAGLTPSGKNSPNEKLNVACIGAGGRGRAAVDAMSGENLVALCDVDWKQAAGTFKAYPKAKPFKDYRVMLDEMGDQIDAVTVSTPDHMHFPAAMAALELGKHVFCEKPLTHTIWEARQLRLKAAEMKVATQMGNQGHALEGCRLMKEWVQAGAIGKVREVHHWTNRPIWPQGIGRPDHSKSKPTAPEGIDWNLWLGVAPDRPYDPAYAPFNWRGWWDFGTGALGDMGCHIMDAANFALDLGGPISVEASSTPVNDETAPKSSVVTYQYPARGNHPPLMLKWYDGALKPSIPAALEVTRQWEDNGTLLVGDDGMMLANTYASSVRIIPEKTMKEFLPNRPEKTIPRIKGGHFNEWLRACKGGPAAGSNFEYSGPFTENVLLGNLALRTGRQLKWDSENLRVTNFDPANAFVTKKYRDGWGH